VRDKSNAWGEGRREKSRAVFIKLRFRYGKGRKGCGLKLDESRMEGQVRRRDQVWCIMKGAESGLDWQSQSGKIGG